MNTYHIHLKGRVQGVGFRPFIYQLACEKGIAGTVSNGVDGVHIYINAEFKTARNFYSEILEKAPVLSRIIQHEFNPFERMVFDGFRIVKENNTLHPNLLITPDLGICPECKSEIFDETNRRFQYAFNTCINCGPRYSIIKEIPYEREFTSMHGFEMCGSCQNEYDSPTTRRHYSQTNSCQDCGIELSYFSKIEKKLKSKFVSQNEIINQTARDLSEGKIIAVKGIGGYLLVCDANNRDSIQQLRERKNRPSKPLALMFPSIESLENEVDIKPVERDTFLSIESPIVLLKIKTESGLPMDLIAPGLQYIGAMQAYTPFFVLLLKKFNQAIVATSGNISGSPIFFKDSDAFENLAEIADVFISNNREIIVPQDDSVVKFSPLHQKRIVLRRSRGFAPSLVHQQFENWNNEGVFAMGADLKSSFSFFTNKNTYTSQFLGNLENYDAQKAYLNTTEHLLELLKTKPNLILYDQHPGYFSTALGRDWLTKYDVPGIAIQHHEAHFAAVLGENNLLKTEKPILGVVWDGTGWGKQSNSEQMTIWGGEFFKFESGRFERIEHLNYFPQILKDKMAREPRLSALSLFKDKPSACKHLQKQFTKSEWSFYNKILSMPAEVVTSSIGRLFDGIAALLNLKDINSFEGEAAMLLEQAALASTANLPFPNFDFTIQLNSILEFILDLVNKDIPTPIIALRFHQILVAWIKQLAIRQSISKIAFSGGVFQNGLLVDLLISELGDEFELYFHKEISPNDECISFGQLCFAYLRQNEKPWQNAHFNFDQQIINEALCV
jgi:hydrogenase maturation protein HypF